MKLLSKCLKVLCDVNRSIVINGDLNLPNIDWFNPNLISNKCRCSVLFALFANELGFEQHVNTITRPSPSANNGIYAGSTIDLVLCNDTHMIHDIEVDFPFSKSDHCSVNFNLSFFTVEM